MNLIHEVRSAASTRGIFIDLLPRVNFRLRDCVNRETSLSERISAFRLLVLVAEK